MSQATYDDANLILRLYEMRREAKMREARNWFFANFRCKSMAEMQELAPPGSDANARFRQFTSYWDMVASFINAGVLNPELFFQSNREMLVAYMRVEPLLQEVRAAFQDPNYMGNLEKAGIQFREWLIQTSGQQAYDGFKARLG